MSASPLLSTHRTPPMLPTARLEYELPPELIATRPAEPRDASRLMVLRRTDPTSVEHARFRDLPNFLEPTDVLVRNRTTVLPARFAARRTDSGGRVSGLYLDQPASGLWSVMLKSNGKLREGTVIELLPAPDHEAPERAPAVRLTLEERSGPVWRTAVRDESGAPATSPAHTLLGLLGSPPLPPYILSARKEATGTPDDPADRASYQTVYADPEAARSVAAPTAGLHFTPELLGSLDEMGVANADVLLDVGAGTFAPVNTEHVEEHPMHAEQIVVTDEATKLIDDRRSAGGRCVCVGTTSVRAIESLAPDAESFAGPTDLLIAPGFAFARTDALITNFHLPRSTLLALVAALFPGDDPVERLLAHYRDAVERGYRFYSYGDAMLILP